MNYTIRDIESITEQQAKEMCLESLTIKGHNVYMIDFPGYFGYSAIVFLNNHHIHYANEYQLHYAYKVEQEGKDSLRGYFIDKLNNKLFTEEELQQPVKTYSEYTAKDYYLRNYYPMQIDYVSSFRIIHNDAEEKAFKKEVAKLHYNPISFCYMADEEFIKHQMLLHIALVKAKEATVDNFEYQKDAFLREMFNHEYGINWQADYDVLSAFGNIEWRRGEVTLTEYFDMLDFTDTQRSAYLAARGEYYRQINERELEEAV